MSTIKKPQPSTPRSTLGKHNIAFDDVKALIAIVAKEQIQEFEFESGDIRFRIRKDGANTIAVAPQPTAAPSTTSPASMPTQTVTPPASQAPAAVTDEPGVRYITSPIVGTFYRAPSPSSTPYVQVGDFVKPGQTLCVVEAMKLMNEIECDTAGEIIKALVDNGQPVEYGERLFAVRIG